MDTISKPLYHFTPSWMLDSIKKTGIREGRVIVQERPPKFKAGHQWLTVNPDFNQSWDALSTLPYDRTENRIEVKIPRIQNLFKWSLFGKKIAGEEMFNVLSAYGDPENWYIYRGIISPGYFVEIVQKY